MELQMGYNLQEMKFHASTRFYDNIWPRAKISAVPAEDSNKRATWTERMFVNGHKNVNRMLWLGERNQS